MQSAKAAKSVSVYEDGIGEEVPFTLFGWRDDSLIATCQTGRVYTDKMLRFHAIAHTTGILRRGWGATACTFLAEGFCVLDEEKIISGVPLPEQFAAGNVAVAECLTFMHVEQDRIIILTLPYKYELGRMVSYGEVRRYAREQYDDNAYAFPLRLQRLINGEIAPAPEDLETYYATLSHGLMEMGMECEWWN